MCGIVGFTHISRKIPDGLLEKALRRLVHRGPDQQSGVSTPCLSLGAARLRIVDIEKGDQPMRSDDGNIVVVYNGEIYNHAELRRELESLGRQFRTECDTEVVLQAYREWGADCFARFRGMFAIGLWIESEQRLILARDRAGIKPLYYFQQGGEIYFASELKCIFAHPDVPRRIDLNALNCFLSLNYVPSPFTLIDGILKLMPGHVMDWRRGRTSTRCFVPSSVPLPAVSNLREATEELDELLERAVAEQMVCDVPRSIWLSGGLDSSTITHYAAKHTSFPLKTFSITFRGKSFDESNYIHTVSSHYGTQHNEFDVNEDAGLADVIADLSYYSDEPSADAGAVPVWYLARMTRPEATVALSGEGADELFGGYITYQADRFRRASTMIPRPMLKMALACARRLPASDEKIGFDYKLKRFLQGSLLSSEAAHVFWNGTFSEDEKRRFFHFADPTPLQTLLAQMPRADSIERFLEFDRLYSLPDALLYKVDRMSMAHSVEVRPPFLDDRIVEFSKRLPQRFKVSGTNTKVVLRALMKNKLPAAVLKRPKTGLDIPIHEWFRGILRPLLEDVLNEATFTQHGLFHWPAVKRLIDQHQGRSANWGYHLWGLLTLALWMRRWNVEAPAMGSPVSASEEKLATGQPSLSWQPASYSARIS